MSGDPIAQVKNLTASYGDEIVLDNVDLAVFPGEILAVIGGSGSGKTTLLKHFIGLIRPQKGTVKLFNEDWWSLDEPEREAVMRRIGVLFQNGALLGSKTLSTNVGIPLEQHTNLPDTVIDKIVRLKLSQVGLADAGDRMPSELSGGMRKRAALARSLALDPDLLFCDEPSAGLDPATTYNLDELLLDLRKELGLAIIVVTHEIASIRRIADRIAYLEHGRMIFIGSLDEAYKSNIESVKNFFEIDSKV